MMRAPSQAAINAAERNVVQCMRNTRDGLRGVRLAFHAAVTRPATLALAVGAAGLFGVWLARRMHARTVTTAAANGVKTSGIVVAANRMLAFLARHRALGARFILQQIQTARQKNL